MSLEGTCILSAEPFGRAENSNSDTKAHINLKNIAESCHKLISQYQWIINAYMSDFFVENLWDKLNLKWCQVLADRDPKELTCLINDSVDDDKEDRDFRRKSVWPLTLLSFRAATQFCSLSRIPIKDASFSISCKNVPSPSALKTEGNGKGAILNGQYLKLEHSFRRHVKPKKQHEIHCLSKLIYDICESVNCDNVVDVGAGQGHLSRLLTFGYGVKVTTVESASSHAPKAKQFDKEVQKDIIKRKNSQTSSEKDLDGCEDLHNDLPNHVIHHIEPSIDAISSNFSKSVNLDPQDHFVLTGLHACGDLIPTLLRLFVNSQNAKAIAVVGCCYMKMTMGSDGSFPLSSFVKRLKPEISWEAFELACHSVDSYATQLKDGTADVKFQSYRAILQTLIEKQHPGAKPQCNKKKSCKKKCNLVDYITSALEQLGLDANLTDSDLENVDYLIRKWRNYGAFHMLRLSLGPVLETLILVDRVLYLQEQGLQCQLIPIFDPKLSPRNFALMAFKN